MLRGLGAHEVVQPSFEAGLEMTRQALLHMEIPAKDVYQYSDAVRRNFYSSLYQKLDYKLLSQLQNAEGMFELNWMEIRPESPLAGQTIGDMKIRQNFGVSVVGIIRDNNLVPNPDAAFRFLAGDMVAVMGKPDEQSDFLVKMN